jgi:glycine cleavage system H lipoate-binding protein
VLSKNAEDLHSPLFAEITNNNSQFTNNFQIISKSQSSNRLWVQVAALKVQGKSS